MQVFSFLQLSNLHKRMELVFHTMLIISWFQYEQILL